jgi:hypothetical protein
MKTPLRFLPSLVLAFACVVHAAPVVREQTLPLLALQDQHAKPWGIKADTHLVVFAACRKPSNMVLEVLSAQPKDFLDIHHAVYVADMSRMPGFVTRTFALPSLREQPFAVGVNLDEKLMADWPRQEDAITLIRLEAGRVTRIEYVRSSGELKAVFGLTGL